jgi:hypothetical protein
MRCFLCEKILVTPEVVRLQQGEIIHKKRGTVFKPRLFEDDTRVKWMHAMCTRAENIHPEELEDSYCIGCALSQPTGGVFEEGNDEAGVYPTCVVRAEVGILSEGRRGPFFHPTAGGNICYHCAHEFWKLPLKELIAELLA